ncbi:MAG: amino acid ABC transporter substrate-binding protein [Oscillospiraceae bacterium]|nr:amino acid ABC transporter substrate-binding protein [Oscillospiraceae bacterium]
MNFKKILSLSLCVFILGLTGCASTSTRPVKVATLADTAPYDYIDENDVLMGIDVEILSKTFPKNEIIVNCYSNEEIFGVLNSDECDIIAAAIPSDDFRLDGFLTTEVYSKTELVIVVKEGSQIVTHYGLVGKKVGCVSNSVAKDYVSEIKDATGLSYEKGSDAVRELLAGKIDAIVFDSSVADIYIDENVGLKKIEKPIYEKSYVMVVSPRRPEIYDALQAKLAEMKEDGTLQEIIDSYITAE